MGTDCKSALSGDLFTYFICSGHCNAFARHLDTNDWFYGGVISSTQVSSDKNPRWRKDIHEVALFKRSKRSEVIKNPEETQDFFMLNHAKGLTPLNRINLCKAFYMLCGHGLQIRAIG